MRGKRWTLLLLTAVVVLAAVKRVQPQQPATMRRILDGKMLPDAEVQAFEQSDSLYPSAIVARGGAVQPLPLSPKPLGTLTFQSGGKQYDIFDYLAENRVAGLLVLKDGKIAFEDYELGTKPDTRWASFSMAKSVSSTLVAIAMQQGFIASLDDKVTKYLPELATSAYQGVSIRNLLQMSSGVKWNEAYTDPSSDCRKLLDAQMTGTRGASVRYMKTLTRAAAPGSLWNYNSGDINIVGALIEAATRKSLSTYLSEVLWSRLGMDQNATWWVEAKGGMGLAGAGFGATLRDYGRFGLFVEQGGVIEGQQVVPKGWFADAGAAHNIGGLRVEYGDLWWPMPAGDPIHAGAFQALGIFGQHLYINPAEKLVIVVLSARSKPIGSTVLDDASFFAAVARQLQ